MTPDVFAVRNLGCNCRNNVQLAQNLRMNVYDHTSIIAYSEVIISMWQM